ncbi:proline-rich receptor-like protein kinase PERK10 isoform X2 [Prosopis cineraria]|uniref:proline-rich receptor-like protein kinase PERK10 isoform X2 n=1 Tax=Prosopis cineraria TaxID=364024 RepID=UPI00240FB7D0|nr:proline-rich receptor-like protein kinase PERK10 isoform X2 [Prosopis cineraria]
MGSPPSTSYVILACDATKDSSEHEIKSILDHVRSTHGILQAGYRLLVLGVLHKVPHPMGYQTLPCPESFAGTNFRAMDEAVGKKLYSYANMLAPIYEDWENAGISIEVKVTAGFPIRQVIMQEVACYNAVWIVLDRHLRRDSRFLNRIPCKVALIKDDLFVDIWRSHQSLETDVTENKLAYSLSKFVSLSDCQSIADIGHSISSFKSCPLSMVFSDNTDTFRNSTKHSFASHEHLFPSDPGSSSKSGLSIKGEYKHPLTSQIFQKQSKYGFIPRSSDAPILCAGCGMRTELYAKESMGFSYSDILIATNDFSKDNLLGEGGYGHVYKGILRDGQQIAAKVRKEESSQGFSEFHSEVYVLSFARHKNIVMLLGYCCKERQNILVYEYICNKSLDWHLFESENPGNKFADKDAEVLKWPQRYAIAIGTAKGLRFLHEECRGGPIIHRDMRPSNILLTHDFVPMLGDFGLAKWKTGGDETMQTRIMGTSGYLAPEYAEEGVVSVGTDVYAYGVVLLQLISGRKVGMSSNPEQPSLRQWAEILIEKLALPELIDPRLGESYDTYELHLMAKAAYFCVQRKPEMRPSMAEVVRLLEGENNHFHALADQFVPNYHH